MSSFTVLFVADVCGRPGRQAAAHLIKPLKEEFAADYVVANIENAAGGFGITPEMSRKMFTYGINVQTSGNHIWDRVQILEYLDESPRLLRPANYPDPARGHGSYVDSVGLYRVGLINLMGRVFMANIDCPFRTADREIEKIREHTPIILVDFHAEATSEKQALLYYLDGKVSAIIGTHTHVQTADEKITTEGTAYISDAGMTGPHDSIIGMEKVPSLGRFLTGTPKRFTTATDDVRMQGVLIRIDAETGRALAIERYSRNFDLSASQGKGPDYTDEQDDD
ncbi:MAG: TIGR00282 family metallophosphoesterase [candidate division Zixibacteria bacterium]|nr:TIGR00282 family metallophosphoesterase [candidate division Zixibacteria bacterium]